MKGKAFVPTESRVYSRRFFVLGTLFLLVCAWALMDEVESRRPWKAIQRGFRGIESARLEDQFAEAERNLAAKVRDEVGLDEEEAPDLESLEARLRDTVDDLSGDPGYRTHLEELAGIDREMEFVAREIRFARSQADELFYRWKHALRTGAEATGFETAWERKHAEIDRLQEEHDSIEAERAQSEEAFREHARALVDGRRALQELEAFRENRDERLATARNRRPEIHQIVLPAFDRNPFGQPEDRVDRCTSCHVAVGRKGFEDRPEPYRTHPDIDMWFSRHPYESMGCTPCHRGQGPALESPFAAHGYRLTAASGDGDGGVEREYLEHWKDPMLGGDDIQSNCPLCHQTFEVEGADVLNRAKLLFAELGCHGCHFHPDFESKERIGPDLTRIRSKVRPSWLLGWLKDPRTYLPKTRMPNYRFDDGQILAVAAYLVQSSEEYDGDGAPARRGSVERGKALVESRGCRGCHSIGTSEAGGYMAPMGYDLVPNLSRIAEKVDADWVYGWLLDPKRFRPTTKMPNLGLTPAEAADIAAYLMTLGEPREPDAGLAERLDDPGLAEAGRTLIYDYGCYSCHEIRGFEDASRIAPPLTGFGNKDAGVELYFGDALIDPAYRAAYGPDPVTWENWTFNKLKHPRIYQDEVSVSKMPSFDLSDENARALIVLLRSFNGRLAPEEYRRILTGHEAKIEAGKNLVRTLNCVGCHVIGDKGGDIRRFYENEALAPPTLTGEGDKVQADWLFKFLKKPTVLRPWLDIRMPYFQLTDAQAQVIVEYFNSLSKRKIHFSFFDTESVPDESRTLGSRLFGVRGAADYAMSLKCDSCHPKGLDLPDGNPADWGPDLFLARKRLKPEWFVEWLRNPQSLQPGTRMPNFFYDYDEFEGEIDVTELLPEPDVKIRALRDYILTEGY